MISPMNLSTRIVLERVLTAGPLRMIGVGNCLLKNVNGAFTTSTFDGADQLASAVDLSGTTYYGFDANGNQKLVVAPSGARTTSNWGFENQVELVVLPSGARVTAAYNAENRRTRLQT